MDNEIFNEDNIPQSNWFKFEKVEDKIGGQVSKVFKKPASGQFPPQLCFTLVKATGVMNGVAIAEDSINVGVKDNDYFRPRLDKVRVGDKLGFHFVKEIPSTIKGNSPAKSITPYHKIVSEEDRAAFVEANPEIANDVAFEENGW